MTKESPEKDNSNKNMLLGGVVSYNCADLKFFITALLFLCSLATVLQFLPSRLPFSLPSNSPLLRPDCPQINNQNSSVPVPENNNNNKNSPVPENNKNKNSVLIQNSLVVSKNNNNNNNNENSVMIQNSLVVPGNNNNNNNNENSVTIQNSLVPGNNNNNNNNNNHENSAALGNNGDGAADKTMSMPRQQGNGNGVGSTGSEAGVVLRRFDTYGAAAYSFILMSAYRGGKDTFVVNGLASKPLHVFGKPRYECKWVGENEEEEVVVEGVRFLPDWGYGRVYTVVVVNCTFPEAVGVDGRGGKLVVVAASNGGGDSKFNVTDTIEALYEAPGSFNLSYFTSPPKYDYLYCGSPLYGDLSPQRVREWIAYHVRFFGEKSHFVIHDAGGIHAEVLAVLRPWIEKGYVTLNDVREQERFDGYYHNQFLIVNDCLHRYRFDAKWMFFFDVDEFIFVPKKKTIKSVTDSLLDYTQYTIQQMPMSGKLCLDDGGRTYKKWGFEKLVYRDSRTRIRRDRKYAVQPRNVFATGVHMSENVVGKTTHKTEALIKYYHYHGTIAQRREPCRQLLNTTGITLEGTPYVMDTTMRDVGATVKRFELKMIGPILQKTRQ